MAEARIGDFPECPYCGAVFNDAWEWGSGGDGEGNFRECGCGKTFHWTRTVSVTYMTTPINESEGHTEGGGNG